MYLPNGASIVDKDEGVEIGKCNRIGKSVVFKGHVIADEWRCELIAIVSITMLHIILKAEYHSLSISLTVEGGMGIVKHIDDGRSVLTSQQYAFIVDKHTGETFCPFEIATTNGFYFLHIIIADTIQTERTANLARSAHSLQHHVDA